MTIPAGEPGTVLVHAIVVAQLLIAPPFTLKSVPDGVINYMVILNRSCLLDSQRQM